MLSSIPIDAFEQADDAVFVADDCGAVRMINRPAQLLLGCAGGEALGRPCWEVARLQYRNGVPFCGPDCPVRRQARENCGRIEKQWLARRRPRGRSLDLELFTVVVGSGPDGRCAELHLMAPVPAPALRRARSGVAVLPGTSFGRPDHELTTRLALVDFDGAKALSTSERYPLSEPLPEDFLGNCCFKVVAAIDRLCEWVNGN